jgi:sulfite reductase (NADPH) flavoprotein alpha-component
MLSAVPYFQTGLLILVWILFSLWSYRGVIARFSEARKHSDSDLIVAYASESGSAEALSTQLADCLRAQGASVQYLPLNQVTPDRLRSLKTLLIIASTYGEGDAPDNGRFFIPALKKAAGQFPGLKFSVLGLGDTNYEHFCGFADAINSSLLDAAASTLAPLVAVDRNDPEAIASWFWQLDELGMIDYGGLHQTDKVSPDGQNHLYELTLSGRRYLNRGSPGAPLYEIQFAVQEPLDWNAGDIVQLHLNGQVREYSIASVPQEGALRLLVREQKHPDGRLGLGSGWLCRLAELGSVSSLSLRSNPSFHCPASTGKLILIGNGSGLAGLRAHLKARELTGEHDNWLIFGERSPETDRHWDDELLRWYESGHLAYLDRSFSRAGDDDLNDLGGSASCGYVQDVVMARNERLMRWIREGATIMVCGSRNGMAQDVDHLLCRLFGEDAVTELTAAGRYRRDVY